jgi:lipopolysaccharide/colanic/teichoic acid biosynthesis glycosyltransferase
MEIRRLTEQRLPLFMGICGLLTAVAGITLLASSILMAVLLVSTLILLVLIASAVDRNKRLDALLEFSPRPKSRLTPQQIGAKVSAIATKRFPNATPPYIRRDLYDDPLEAALRGRKRFVVLRGVTNSGKTRAVFEAIGVVLGEHKIVVPNDPAEGDDALSEILHRRWLLRRFGRYVLVVNDLENRLSALHGYAVRKWLRAHPRSRVVATMSAEHWAQLLAEEQSPTARQATKLLDNAASVPFAPEFNGPPLSQARELYGLPKGQTRLGAYLASAERAVARFEVTKGGDHGAAHALAMAGIDCARAGLFRPVAIERLLEMAKRVADCEGQKFTSLAWTEAIGYCTDSQEGVGAILEAHGSSDSNSEPRVVANPALVELVERGPGRNESYTELPRHVWQAIIDLMAEGPFDLLRIAGAASWRGRQDLTQSLLERIEGEGDEEPAKLAAARLREPLRLGEPSFTTDLLERSTVGPTQRSSARRRKIKTIEMHSTIFDPKNNRSEPWRKLYRRQVVRDCGRFLILLACDIFAVCAGILIAKPLGAVAFTGSPDGFSSSTVVAIAALLVLLFFLLFGLYRADRERARLREILKGVLLAALVLSLLVIGQGFALINLPLALFAAGVAIGLAYLFRSAYDGMSRRWVKAHGLQSRVLLLCSDRPTEVAHLLASGCRRPMQMVGYLSGQTLGEPGMLGSFDSLRRITLEYEIDRVIIAEPDLSPRDRLPIIYRCHSLDLVTEVVPNAAELFQGASEALDDMIVPLVRVRPLYLNYVDKFAKRGLDIALATLILPVLLLALLVVGLPMKMRNRGERVITWDYRPGLGAAMFPMRRFRTEWDGSATRLGRLLERFRLNELPQVLNVLEGTMSMVGPRPLAPEEFEILDEFQRARNTVLPGLTGLWQVAGRKESSLDDMSSLDIVYCRNWTPLLDLTILLRTVPAVRTPPA